MFLFPWWGRKVSFYQTHQLLAIILCIRVKRILSAGIAIMLFWGFQWQGGLVPAWGKDRCYYLSHTSELCYCQTCAWPAVRELRKWKSERKTTKSLLNWERTTSQGSQYHKISPTAFTVSVSDPCKEFAFLWIVLSLKETWARKHQHTARVNQVVPVYLATLSVRD